MRRSVAAVAVGLYHPRGLSFVSGRPPCRDGKCGTPDSSAAAFLQ